MKPDDPGRKAIVNISVESRLLGENDLLAAANRRAFNRRGLCVLNLVSSPGSGKTTLLVETIQALKDRLKCAVIEGDQQTDYDARRIAGTGVPVVQINTGQGCHLDAGLVGGAVARLDLDGVDLLFIENVGNLVCPSNYDLGEAMKVVVASTTEGDDKPLKYPAMFHNASVLIINKIDLLPYIPSTLAALKDNALKINPSLTVFEMSCTTRQGMDVWCDWLLENAQQKPAS